MFCEGNGRGIKGRYGDTVIEIASQTLPDQLRAWWVPWFHVRGPYRVGEFTSAEALRRASVEPMLVLFRDQRCDDRAHGRTSLLVACAWTQPADPEGDSAPASPS